jgi:hypothetical protein
MRNLMCLSDLGTSLAHISVLWLSRCKLVDVDGIGSLPLLKVKRPLALIYGLDFLKELYLSFNHVRECNPLTMLEQLRVLDLEGFVVTVGCGMPQLLQQRNRINVSGMGALLVLVFSVSRSHICRSARPCVS